MKINYKLNLLIISLLVIMTVLVAGSVNFMMGQTLEEEMRDNELGIAGYVAGDLANPLLDENDLRVQEIIDDLKRQDADVRYAYVISFDGTVVAHTFSSGFPVELVTANPIPSGEDSAIQILSAGEESIQDVGVRVLEGMDAKVYIGFSRVYLLECLARVTNTIIGIAALILLFGIGLTFFLTRTLTKPIGVLVEGTKRVAGGDLDFQIDVACCDEIGTLTDSFNRMTAERKQAEEGLAKYREHLEELVKERTNQLEEKTAELQQANIHLQELDRLKSMFIASMSHELRTPLNSIIGFTGIILRGMTGEITEEQRKQLTMVKNSANHLLALINDIIDVSKIEAGKVELVIEEFDLSGLMQEVKDSFSVTAAEKSLKMPLDMPETLTIESDERRTKQVIVNLVGNAVKFTDKGEIEINVTKKEGLAAVSVRDTGVGIRKEDLDKLFKAFRQIPIEGGLKEGTGLGLYLSKKIANLLGGEIKAESEFGKGCLFTFTLPLKYKEAKT